MIHSVLNLIAGRGWFSAHQAARATYFGQGWVHPQQRKRVREVLNRYVTAGVLEYSDQIAACRLYRHVPPASALIDHPDVNRLKYLAKRRLKPSEQFLMRMLRGHMDSVVPRHTNPALFNQHGHLILRPWYPPRAQPDPSTVNPLTVLGPGDLTVSQPDT